jgi:membrane-associated phospholipid phosphatase
VLALVFPAPGRFRILIPALNAILMLCYALLAYAGRERRDPFLSVVRDWLPLAFLLFAYQEMGWFATPMQRHDLELAWVGWDRAVLHGGLSRLVEALGPAGQAYLEICYTLVYALPPVSLAVLYLFRRRKAADEYLFLVAIGVLLCYVQFAFWPSEPPRTVFPGADFPRFHTVFRDFNFAMLKGYGIHTSVFPSAHVAGAFSAAFGLRRALPDKPWVFRLALWIAASIATATVYGRYHYLADAMAGFGMSLVAVIATAFTYRKKPGLA